MSQELSGAPTNRTLNPWKAESLRFTAFLPQGISTDTSDWWLKSVGEAPEARIAKLREGTLREEGPFLSGRLVLAVEPLRVDWVLAGDMQAVLDSGSFDSLPDFVSSTPSFFALAKRWLALGAPVSRVALGAVLLMAVRDREEGYRRLSSYLPDLAIDPVGSSDLLYQINRRRVSSSIDGLAINRLSKWSVASIQSTRFHIGPSTIPSVQTVGEGLAACRLELDISTAQESSGSFRPESIEALLDELIQLALEISREGDRP